MKIYLIGFMGCGKSTIGGQLARILETYFADTDHIIEHEYGMTVDEMFEKHGEAAFREAEHEILLKIKELNQAVVATGGGMPCHHDNMDIMIANGTVMYLKADPHTLVERLIKSETVRPLIKDKTETQLLEYITEKLREREPFYNRAHITVPIETMEITALTKEFQKRYTTALKKSPKKGILAIVAVFAILLVAIFGIKMINNAKEQKRIAEERELAINDSIARLEAIKQQAILDSLALLEARHDSIRRAQRQQEVTEEVARQPVPNIAMVFVQGNSSIRSFNIGKYEITQVQWQAVMGNNPSEFVGAHLPVQSVSWNDVQDFIRKLNEITGRNYRLPTEAEWEFAARCGNSSRDYEYSGSNNIDDVAWYSCIKNNIRSTPRLVGTKAPNELLIHDMSGNVMEWCQDAEGFYRVLRGGSWLFSPEYCRVAKRGLQYPDARCSSTGFRVVLP